MIRPLAAAADLDAALALPLALIYKHSPRCGVCTASQQEVRFFAEGHPAVPVYQIDVVEHRALARTIAERLGVRHESPQAILVAAGRAIWDASHWDIRATDVEQQTQGFAAG